MSGGGTGEGCTMIERATKAPEVEQSLGSAIEGNAHAVEQVDDGGRGVAHITHWWLVGEKVAAVDGVVEMLRGGVAFTLEVLGRVDATLRAHRVRALHRNNGEQINVAALFRDLDDGREPG